MGGRASEGYALFSQMTIKAFLAIRPHASQIVEAIHLMLGTGLPSFKGEPTIRRLRERFALHLNERQAAEWMNSIIRNAYENVRSTIYDEFQRVCCVGFGVNANGLTTARYIGTKWYVYYISFQAAPLLSTPRC